MKNSFFLFLLLCSLCHAASGQSIFQKSIGRSNGDYAMHAVKAGTGIAISGTSGNDVFLVRIDADGDTLWTKTYASSASLTGSWLRETADNGFVIVGAGTLPSGAGGDDVVLIRTDSEGNLQWSKVYGTPSADYGTAVVVDDDGILMGGAVNITVNANDALIIKTNLLGDTLWTRTFGGNGDENVNAIELTPDGGCIAVGTSTSFSKGSNAVMVSRWSATGELQDYGIYGNSGNSYGFGVVSAGAGGGYIITGVTTGAGAGGNDVLLMKINEDMDIAWSKTYGGSDFDSGVSVVKMESGGFVTLGQTFSYGVASDLFLVRTDNDGELTWAKAFGGDGYEFGETVLALPDGFFITGGEESFGANRDLYMVKTDLDGNSNCNQLSVDASSADGLIGLSVVGFPNHGGLHSAAASITSHSGASVHTFCESVNVREAVDSDFKIYPNPFNESITVRGTSAGEMLVLYDINGKRLSECSLKSATTTIDTSMLATGVYVINILNKNGVQNWKLVKD